jgi:hypothetical protein
VGKRRRMRENEVLLSATKWIELENIILSEITRYRKTSPCILSHMKKLKRKVGLNIEQ